MSRFAIAALLLGQLATTAHADNPSLADARRAVQDVRYDDARRLLVAALATGTNTPAELVEIYRLAAATSVVLGDGRLAVQYYRRMIALDPAADLPPDASPKLREPFVAARAFMDAQGHLDARVTWVAAGIKVEITDPLGMVAAVAATAGGTALPRQRVTGQAIVIAHAVDTIALVDEHGNHVREIAVPTPTARTAIVAVGATTPAAPVPLLRNWTTWMVPTAVFAGVGIGFAIEAHDAQTALDRVIATSSTHFLSTATAERDREQRDSIISTASFVVAGACAVTGVVTAITRRSESPVQATIGRDQVGLAVVGRF